MKMIHKLMIAPVLILFSTSVISPQDLSKHRNFSLGMHLAELSKQVNASAGGSYRRPPEPGPDSGTDVVATAAVPIYLPGRVRPGNFFPRFTTEVSKKSM
jgi:hypothetical protein